jgi:hypothetical protein
VEKLKAKTMFIGWKQAGGAREAGFASAFNQFLKNRVNKVENSLDFFQNIIIMLELVYPTAKQSLEVTYDAHWRSGKSTEGKQVSCIKYPPTSRANVTRSGGEYYRFDQRDGFQHRQCVARRRFGF